MAARGLTLRRDLNSLFDRTRDLGSRLFGVFPRRERQCDERSLILAADAEAVARPRHATGKRHRHNLAHLAILVRRLGHLLFLGRDSQDHVAEPLAGTKYGPETVARTEGMRWLRPSIMDASLRHRLHARHSRKG
jgi:hypothetical protein